MRNSELNLLTFEKQDEQLAEITTRNKSTNWVNIDDIPDMSSTEDFAILLEGSSYKQQGLINGMNKEELLEDYYSKVAANEKRIVELAPSTIEPYLVPAGTNRAEAMSHKVIVFRYNCSRDPGYKSKEARFKYNEKSRRSKPKNKMRLREHRNSALVTDMMQSNRISA